MSFDIALSGIQAINEQLTTISNNIANAGTVGFKSSRANFSSMYAGERATGTQIGSVSQSIGLNGGVLRTDKGLDALINGRGFFVTKDSQGQENYTRVGIFDTNEDGFLTDASGRRVQGYAMTPGSTVEGARGDIQVPTGQIPAKASTKIDFVANVSADGLDYTDAGFIGPDPSVTPPLPADTDTFHMQSTSVLYDSKGVKHTLSQYFVRTSPTTVSVFSSVNGGAVGAPFPLTFKLDGTLDMTDPTLVKSALTYQPQNAGAVDSADPMAFIVDYTGTTLAAGTSTPSTNKPDGYAPGTFLNSELGKDGSVIARYSNGERQTIAKVVLASFAAEGQLAQISDTSWLASAASGSPLYGAAGTGVLGSLSVGSLEQSNVDITAELVGLMTSQRNYQANSKVIQTESTMLQSLMQAL